MSSKTNEAALEALIERYLTGSCREDWKEARKAGEEHIAYNADPSKGLAAQQQYRLRCGAWIGCGPAMDVP